jgi:uncharacterized protein DUF6660
MKFISFILSLYLLFLIATPCCVFDNCPEDSVVGFQTSGHEKSDEDGCGSCSPFFNCAGCASVSIHSEVIFPGEVRASELKNFIAFVQPFFPKTYSDFWQPPKIG